MTEPVRAQNSPYQVELEPGKYWWCACGKSAKQPFCDGSHKGGPFTPVEIALDAAETLWLCGCKRTGNAPKCDGTHNK